MSLFLGRIHYWLYNKIVWFEAIEEEIVEWAKGRGLPVEEWTRHFHQEYGRPVGKKPLEEIIDTSNIHGWLQQRITSAELRQAALVTEILNKEPQSMGELITIYSEQGEKVARECQVSAPTPESAYNALNDFILEGMPCDQVSQPIAGNDEEFVWKTTMCLHKPYWDQVEGDVQNFYDLREAWVKAFVNTLNPAFRYEKLQDEGVQRIIRQ